VHSRLERFLTLAVQGILNVRFATLDELTAMSYLSLGVDQAVDGTAILKNSYGMYRTFPAVKDQVSASANAYLTQLKTSFVSASNAPEWIPDVTYRTGLDYFFILRLHQALQSTGRDIAVPESFGDALAVLFGLLSALPPQRARIILATEIKEEGVAVLWDSDVDGDNPSWRPPQAWLDAWSRIQRSVALFCQGQKLTVVGRELLGEEIASPSRNSGAPIPKIISFTRTDISNFSQVAGAVLAMFEARGLIEAGSMSSLSMFPLSLKYGCDTREALAWYRFGIRYRRPAHLLAKILHLPSNISSDGDTRAFVRTSFARFIDSEELPPSLTVEESRLLNSLRKVIRASGNR
jgi:hypothetical protein